MKVMVVDDDKLVSLSLKTILEADSEIEVAGIGENGKQAVELYAEVQPDVLLMDIRMDGMTGIEAAEMILVKDKNAKILFLTTFQDDDYIAKAFRIGAKGYILKQNFGSIIPSIKAVFMGQRVFGDEIISRIPVFANTGTLHVFPDSNISGREIEIITLVAQGLSNREIAETLFLGEGTVRNYISTILEKLNLRDRTQLAIYYYKHL